MSLPASTTRASMIERLGPWFHNLHLPDGTQTAPDHRLGDFPRYKWEVLHPHLPASLEGWTALDLGCNAGFYTFELARRGAKVTAIDLDEHYLTQHFARGLEDRPRQRVGLSFSVTRDLRADLNDPARVRNEVRHVRDAALGEDGCDARLGELVVGAAADDRGARRQREVARYRVTERAR